MKSWFNKHATRSRFNQPTNMENPDNKYKGSIIDNDGPKNMSKGPRDHGPGGTHPKEKEETTAKTELTTAEARGRVAASIKETDASRQSFKTLGYRKGENRLKVNDPTQQHTNKYSRENNSQNDVLGSAGNRLASDEFGNKTSVVKEKSVIPGGFSSKGIQNPRITQLDEIILKPKSKKDAD